MVQCRAVTRRVVSRPCQGCRRVPGSPRPVVTPIAVEKSPLATLCCESHTLRSHPQPARRPYSGRAPVRGVPWPVRITSREPPAWRSVVQISHAMSTSHPATSIPLAILGPLRLPNSTAAVDQALTALLASSPNSSVAHPEELRDTPTPPVRCTAIWGWTDRRVSFNAGGSGSAAPWVSLADRVAFLTSAWTEFRPGAVYREDW